MSCRGCIGCQPETLDLELPLPPSVNHSHKHVRARAKNGKPFTRRVPTSATLQWRLQGYDLVRRAIMAQHWRQVADGKVVVDIWYRWPDARKRDTHNRIKELMDLLQTGGAFANDCQALAREQDFTIDRKRPCIEVRVRRAS